MLKRFAIKSSLLLFVICLFSCGTVRVYKEPDKPVLFSNGNSHRATEQGLKSTEQADSLNVLTFNIEKAKKIQLAISEFQLFEQTRSIDIYLLQEMDETGVEAIAKEFNLNYLYFPIVYNKLIKKNIGNAILTKGTIGLPEKLLLPHSKWLNKRRRHVTIGEVNIHQRKILVYCVHTETVMMCRKKRMDQLDAIIEHVKVQAADYKYVLIGGDLNTLFSKDGRLAVEKFNSSGFDWATAAVGSTARAFFGLVHPAHDYLFSKGLKVMSAGKIEASKSSDHYPVFASFGY